MLEGTLEVTINGKSTRISRGSQPGETLARYYVVELGPRS